MMSSSSSNRELSRRERSYYGVRPSCGFWVLSCIVVECTYVYSQSVLRNAESKILFRLMILGDSKQKPSRRDQNGGNRPSHSLINLEFAIIHDGVCPPSSRGAPTKKGLAWSISAFYSICRVAPCRVALVYWFLSVDVLHDSWRLYWHERCLALGQRLRRS